MIVAASVLQYCVLATVDSSLLVVMHCAKKIKIRQNTIHFCPKCSPTSQNLPNRDCRF